MGCPCWTCLWGEFIKLRCFVLVSLLFSKSSPQQTGKCMVLLIFVNEGYLINTWRLVIMWSLRYDQIDPHCPFRLSDGVVTLTHQDKIAGIAGHFQLHFLEWKCIGSDNGLAPTTPKTKLLAFCRGHFQLCQAIIWTNDGQIIDAYRRHLASMS